MAVFAATMLPLMLLLLLLLVVTSDSAIRS
jgi:hypothetical protein